MAFPIFFFFYMGVMAKAMMDPFAVYQPKQTITRKKED